jgi:hypothetical protein
MSENNGVLIGEIKGGSVVLRAGTIPIPESLEIGSGSREGFLVYCTTAGVLALEIDGKLRTRFDHVSK